MSLEENECTAADGSVLRAYDTGADTIVLHITDLTSFTNGVHEARIELPLGQLRELFNEGFS